MQEGGTGRSAGNCAKRETKGSAAGAQDLPHAFTKPMCSSIGATYCALTIAVIDAAISLKMCSFPFSAASLRASRLSRFSMHPSDSSKCASIASNRASNALKCAPTSLRKAAAPARISRSCTRTRFSGSSAIPASCLSATGNASSDAAPMQDCAGRTSDAT
jgi:hypothetical protein